MGKKQQKTKVVDNSPTVLSLLNRALAINDVTAAASALNQLIAQYPAWTRLLAHIDALPEPANPSTDPSVVAQRCRTLVQAVHSTNLPDTERMWASSLALITARSAVSFARLRTFLGSLTFFSDSLATQTYRLAVLMEHQSRQGYRLAAEHGTVGDNYHPYAVLDHYLPTRTGGRASILGAYEELVEAVELILRYAHYSADPEKRKGVLEPKDPFDDPDLERLLKAAGIWLAQNDIFTAVKYARWRTHELSNSHACYAPSDHAEYMRYRVGEIREQAILAQFSMQMLDPQKTRGYHEQLISLSTQIQYPAPGQVWNGQYPATLGDLIRADRTFILRADEWTTFRHYEPFTRAIKLDGSEHGWAVWLAARNALNILAQLFSSCLTLPGKESLDDDWRRYVIVVQKRDLIEVAQESGITKEQAEVAVATMIFDQKRRSLELWDQPLLPLSEEHVIFVPSLLGAASPARVLENAVAQWSPSEATARGFPFETDVLHDVQALGHGSVQKNIKIIDDDNKSVEYDLLWWWQGHLFLIEAKCLQSVHGFADYDRAKANIDYGFEQLRRRRRILRTKWDQLRVAATQMSLPSACPPDTNIVGLVLTNLTCFTEWVTDDGLIVSDDVCFRRYFGNPAINVYRRGINIGEEFVTQLGSIRSSVPSPTDFVFYLLDPPQCRSVREKLVSEMVNSVASETKFPMWRMMIEYHPDLTEWFTDR